MDIHTLGDLLRDKSCGGRKDAEEGGDNGLHGSNLFNFQLSMPLNREQEASRGVKYVNLGIACPSFSLLNSLVDIMGTAAIFGRQMSTSGSC